MLLKHSGKGFKHLIQKKNNRKKRRNILYYGPLLHQCPIFSRYIFVSFSPGPTLCEVASFPGISFGHKEN